MIHEGTCYGPYEDESRYADTDPHWEKNLTAWGCEKKKVNNMPCSFTVSTCPTTRHAHAFDGATNPHTPMWNASAAGPLPSQMDLPPISPWLSRRMDIGFRNRSATLLDLDDLIGVVVKGVQDLGLADNTYIMFSGDNVRARGRGDFGVRGGATPSGLPTHTLLRTLLRDTTSASIACLWER